MSLESIIEQERIGKRMRHQADFKTFDRKALSVKDDRTLAEWQSEFDQDEPQWRLAEHEWQRRITASQIRSARWTAGVGIAGVIMGAFIQWFLSSWHPFKQQGSAPLIQAQTQASPQQQQQSPVNAPKAQPSGPGATTGHPPVNPSP